MSTKIELANLGDRLQQLVLQEEPTQKEPTDPLQKGLHKRLIFKETKLRDIASTVEAIERGPELDRCLLKQHEEQISGLKSELTDVLHNIATLEEDETGLKDRRLAISQTIFNNCLRIQRLLSDQAATPSTTEAKSGIKLPKLNVPTFDGNILNWSTFWQQFDMAIHSKAQLKDAEKLAYFRDALRDGPARNVVEGLSQDADYYKEAIGCLRRHYDPGPAPPYFKWSGWLHE